MEHYTRGNLDNKKTIEDILMEEKSRGEYTEQDIQKAQQEIEDNQLK